MHRVYFGLGSNLGNREVCLGQAIEMMKRRIGKEFSQSFFYETRPWGFASNHSFLNAVAGFESEMEPELILSLTQQIEKDLGRGSKSTGGRYTDRTIDIDILFYDDLVFKSADLVIPHPLLQERDFVLRPMAEIAPDLVHPVLHRTISQLLEMLVTSGLENVHRL
jgi:2-amino-4-hydroxy-6-hydroxymethyldihydropteridine diphosphokinase